MALADALVLSSPDPVRARRHRRWAGLLVLGLTLPVLLVAAWLDPDPAGSGTHRQLNLPPCGWMVTADIPCPTCGMTTAFAHAAEGSVLRSLAAQPLGALLALLTAMGAIIGGYTAATGSRAGVVLGGLWGRRTPILLVGLLLAAWGWKIAVHTGFLVLPG